MPRVPQSHNNTTPVEKFDNTAYDAVELVAENIEDVILAAGGVDVMALYLGAFDTEPTEGKDGADLVSGNFYLDTSSSSLKYWDDTHSVWVESDVDTVVTAAQEAQAARDAAQAAQSAAETAETNASNSASNAASSASAAALSASAAATSADNASTSETNAATSANNAANSETAAGVSEAAAATSESNASTSATNAQASETNAAASAVTAANAASQAEAAFDNFDDMYLGRKTVPPTTDNDGHPLQVGASYWHDFGDDTGEQRFWNGASWESPELTATQAAQAAVAARDDAQISETNAELYKDAAQASANAAGVDANNAGNSATAAATSESNAADSASAANDSENAARASETNAATSASDASDSADAAAVSEANAAASASIFEWQRYVRDEADLNTMREQNKDVRAASGFDIYGKQYELGVGTAVNEGLWVFPSTGYENKLCMGRNSGANGSGPATMDMPVTCIAGILNAMYYVNNPGDHNFIKFSEAPNGIVIYDSDEDARGTGNAILNLADEVDPKYGDIAGSVNEAVARAFEGELRNGDFRNGSDNWVLGSDGRGTITDGVLEFRGGSTGSTQSVYTDYPTYSIDAHFPAGTTVICEVAISGSVNYANLILRSSGYDGNPQQQNVQSLSNAPDGVYTLQMTMNADSRSLRFIVETQSGGGNGQVNVHSVSIRKGSEEVVIDRHDVFGGEFFLEEVSVANPYVYPKGMIQSKAPTMNGITTVRSNRPGTYYQVFDGDLDTVAATHNLPVTSGFTAVGNYIEASGTLFSSGDNAVGGAWQSHTEIVAGRTYELSFDVTLSSQTTSVDLDLYNSEGTTTGDSLFSATSNITGMSLVRKVRFTATGSGLYWHLSGGTGTHLAVINSMTLVELASNPESPSAGLGVDFWAASIQEKIDMVSDVTNNLFLLKDGRLVQWRMRQVTITSNKNGDWYRLGSNNPFGQVLSTFPSAHSYVSPQGMKDSAPTWYDTDAGSTSVWYPNTHNSGSNSEVGVYKAGISDVTNDETVGIDGECYFHVWGVVRRLNQGAFHPSFNPLGTAKTVISGVGWLTWYHSSNDKLKSAADCFKSWTGTGWGVGGGNIAAGQDSGTVAGGWRPDERYYDAIYEGGDGGVNDYRLSSWDMSSKEEAAKVFQKVVNGTYRGEEDLIQTVFVGANDGEGSVSDYIWFNYETFPDGYTAFDIPIGSAVGSVNRAGVGSFMGFVIGHNDGSSIILDRGSPRTDELYLVAFPTGSSVSGEFQMVDVLGDPADILATPDLANGWQGGWQGNHDQDGTTDPYPLTRKSLNTGTTMSYLLTEDFGNTWQTGTTPFSPTTNSVSYTATPNRVMVNVYSAFAKQTVEANNTPVLNAYEGIGEVEAFLGYQPLYGVLFAESLMGKVCTTSASGHANRSHGKPTNTYFIATGEIGEDSDRRPTHVPLYTIAPNNDSPAVKALWYQTANSQQVSLNFAWNELVWASDLSGLYTSIPFATPMNSSGVSVGARYRFNDKFEGYYICRNNNQTSATFQSQWDSGLLYVNGNGDLLRHDNNVLAMEKVALSGWGDDSTVHIVDGTSTYTNLNGDTCSRGTATLSKPIGYTKNQARVGTQAEGVDF